MMNKNTSLLFIDVGHTVCFKQIKDRYLAGRLATMGLIPGIRIKVLRKDRRHPMVVLVRNTRIALGREIARQIMIETSAA